MASTTTNLGLTKPAYSDDADISDINGNMDLIDAEAGRVRANVAANYDSSETYAVGDYVEMCRGPHVEHSKQIGVVKLTRVAGSYYRGDEKNKMLQRIYGIVAKDQAELDEIVARAEEAKRRDHRRLGTELGFFLILLLGTGVLIERAFQLLHLQVCF